MLDWIKVITLQICLLSYTLTFQQDPSPELGGTFNCRTGVVQIVRLKDAVPIKEEFKNIDEAVVALRKADFSVAGIAMLKQILTEACALQSEPNALLLEKASMRTGFVDRAASTTAQKGSLIWLEKKGDEIEFNVVADRSGIVEYDDKGKANSKNPARSIASWLLEGNKTMHSCKPISKVCVKCSDGQIVCTSPKLR